MSAQIDGSCRTFLASGAIKQYARVKFDSGVTIIEAVADEDCIGVAQAPAADGDYVAVKLKKSPGTFQMIASEAIAAGATIYGAAAGKVTDTDGGSYTGRGTALEASTGDGAIIEVLLD